jgi:hypothetical protein
MDITVAGVVAGAAEEFNRINNQGSSAWEIDNLNPRNILANRVQWMGLNTNVFSNITGGDGNATTQFNCFAVKPDGTRLYITGYNTNDYIYQVDLAEAWNLYSVTSIATLVNNLATLRAVNWDGGIDISSNGLHLIACDTTYVHQWNFNTPWDGTDGITYVGKSISVGVGTMSTGSTQWVSDGSGIIVSGQNNIKYLPCTTPYDITTLTTTGSNSHAGGIGRKVWVTKNGGAMVWLESTTFSGYGLGTAWRPGTRVATGGNPHTFSRSSRDFMPWINGNDSTYSNPNALWVEQDYQKVLIGFGSGNISWRERSTPANNINNTNYPNWDGTTTLQYDHLADSNSGNFGNKSVFISGSTYHLLAANPGSTSGFVHKMWWKPDGTRFYLSGGSADRVVGEFHCSVPWDLRTMSFKWSRTITGSSLSFQANPVITPDGSKLIVMNTTSTFYSYVLDAPWSLFSGTATTSNLSTTGLVQASIGTFNGCEQFDFSDDGMKLFVLKVDEMRQYQLTAPYTIAGATQTTAYTSSNFFNAILTPIRHVSRSSPFLRGFCFGNNGTKLYMLVQNAGNTMHMVQFSCASPYTLQGIVLEKIAPDNFCFNLTIDSRSLQVDPTGTNFYSVDGRHRQICQWQINQ